MMIVWCHAMPCHFLPVSAEFSSIQCITSYWSFPLLLFHESWTKFSFLILFILIHSPAVPHRIIIPIGTEQGVGGWHCYVLQPNQLYFCIPFLHCISLVIMNLLCWPWPATFPTDKVTSIIYGTAIPISFILNNHFLIWESGFQMNSTDA